MAHCDEIRKLAPNCASWVSAPREPRTIVLPTMNSQEVVQPPSSSDWNPSLYVKFDDERMLAAGDLLFRAF